MKIFRSKKLSWKIAIIVVTVTFIVGMSLAIYFEMRVISLIGHNSRIEMQLQTNDAAAECDNIFTDTFYRVANLRNLAESVFKVDEYKIDAVNYFDNDVRAAMDRFVYNTVKNAEHITAAYFAVHPDLAGFPLVREVYFEKTESGVNSTEPQTYEEYMQTDSEDMAWFYEAYNSGKPYWTKIHDFEGVLMVSYAEPVIIDSIKVGVVGIDIAIDEIIDLLKDIKVYDTGFAILKDNRNQILESNDFIRNLSVQDKEKFMNLSRINFNEIFEIELGGVHYMVSQTRLVNDYDIYILAPKNEYNAETALSILKFVILFPIVLVTVTSICYFIGKAISKPLITATESLNIAIENINAAAVHFTTAAASLNEVSNEQAAAIEETSATMNQTAAMAQQNTETTFHAKELAQTAGETLGETLKHSEEMINSMNELSRSSEEITKIISTITNISSQTSILALNASVEAVRAGNAGNSFSVVAEEVRNLSQQSSAAANTTEAIIINNRELTEKNAMKSSTVSKTLVEVGENAKKVVELLNDISLASEDQLHAIQQINAALSQMEKTTQSNAAVSEETAAAANMLKDLTDKLGEVNTAIDTVVYGVSMRYN